MTIARFFVEGGGEHGGESGLATPGLIKLRGFERPKHRILLDYGSALTIYGFNCHVGSLDLYPAFPFQDPMSS